MEEKLWSFLLAQMEESQPFSLLLVLESFGSSPGRAGFAMVVTENALFGSIGGGMMEHKMVELARDHLKKNQTEIWVKRQVHSKESADNQSGMICSGEQTLAYFHQKHWTRDLILAILNAFQNRMPLFLIFSPFGVELKSEYHQQTGYRKTDKEDDWQFIWKLAVKPTIHIIGGGHVGLAFSKVMSLLGFYVVVYDNRTGLNTMEFNTFSNEKRIIDYHETGLIIPEGPNEWVAVMTFGYRTDGQVIRHLIGKSFAYLGLLGSKAKITQMMQELDQEGFPQKDLEKIYAPIGLSIKSQTPEEIAISIAAEIIQIRNAEK